MELLFIEMQMRLMLNMARSAEKIIKDYTEAKCHAAICKAKARNAIGTANQLGTAQR